MINCNEKDIPKLVHCLDTLTTQLDNLAPIEDKFIGLECYLKETDNKALAKQFSRAFSSFRKSIDNLVGVEDMLTSMVGKDKPLTQQNIINVDKTEIFEDEDFDAYALADTSSNTTVPTTTTKETFTITENGETREGTEEEKLKFKTEFEKSMASMEKEIANMQKMFTNKFTFLNNRANSLFKSLGV